MKVTEEQRRALFEQVRDHLDEDTATLLLEVTVPANVDLATRGDIQELRAEMLLHFTQLDGRLTTQITQLDGRMTALDGRLTKQITALDGRLTKQMTALDGRITGLEVRIDKVGTDLARKLYVVVIPVLSGVTLVLVGLATWIGILVG
jgi:hypothetical protein